MKASMRVSWVQTCVFGLGLLAGGTVFFLWADGPKESETEKLASSAVASRILEAHNRQTGRGVSDLFELSLDELQAARQVVRDRIGEALSQDLIRIELGVACQVIAVVLWVVGGSVLVPGFVRRTRVRREASTCPEVS